MANSFWQREKRMKREQERHPLEKQKTFRKLLAKEEEEEEEEVSNLINACIFKLWISNYVFTKLDSREILDIFLPITTSKLLNID